MSRPKINAATVTPDETKFAFAEIACRTCGGRGGRACYTPSGRRRRVMHAVRLRDAAWILRQATDLVERDGVTKPEQMYIGGQLIRQKRA